MLELRRIRRFGDGRRLRHALERVARVLELGGQLPAQGFGGGREGPVLRFLAARGLGERDGVLRTLAGKGERMLSLDHLQPQVTQSPLAGEAPVLRRLDLSAPGLKLGFRRPCQLFRLDQPALQRLRL